MEDLIGEKMDGRKPWRFLSLRLSRSTAGPWREMPL